MLRRYFLRATPRPLFPCHEEFSSPDEYALLRFSRSAMATTFEIDLPLGTPHAAEAAGAALDLIDEIEDQLTIYREESAVSGLNTSAFDSPVIVDKRLFQLLEDSARLTQRSRGGFDIACGTLIQAWGFHRRAGRIPTPGELSTARQSSGIKHVILDSENSSVRFRKAGLRLNLGSIGKGYALDRAGELLKSDWGIRSSLLHAGGSSVLALGRPPHRRGWPVMLRHPTQGDRTLGVVHLHDTALATSAATYQHFEYNGRKYGHVIDPRTGWPAENTASVSVVAAAAAEADALATAAFVLGLPDARAIVATAVILEAADDVIPTVFGFEADDFTPPGLSETIHHLLTFPE